MNKIFRIALIALICLTSVSASYGGTYDLMNLIENKDFWSNFNWGNFEDSELYKSTQWKIRGYHTDHNNNRTDDYSANVDLGKFSIGEITAQTTNNKDVYYITMFSQDNYSQDIYSALVNWCLEKYGNDYNEYKNRRGNGKYIQDITTSTWKLNNSTIMVMIENKVVTTDVRPRFITSLIFQPNKVEVYNVEPSPIGQRRPVSPPSRPSREEAVPVAPYRPEQN